MQLESMSHTNGWVVSFLILGHFEFQPLLVALQLESRLVVAVFHSFVTIYHVLASSTTS